MSETDAAANVSKGQSFDTTIERMDTVGWELAQPQTVECVSSREDFLETSSLSLPAK